MELLRELIFGLSPKEIKLFRKYFVGTSAWKADTKTLALFDLEWLEGRPLSPLRR